MFAEKLDSGRIGIFNPVTLYWEIRGCGTCPVQKRSRLPPRGGVDHESKIASKCSDLTKMTLKNVKTRTKCSDLTKMTFKNVKMRSKCDDLSKITFKNVKMQSKCDDLLKMTFKNIKNWFQTPCQLRYTVAE